MLREIFSMSTGPPQLGAVYAAALNLNQESLVQRRTGLPPGVSCENRFDHGFLGHRCGLVHQPVSVLFDGERAEPIERARPPEPTWVHARDILIRGPTPIGFFRRQDLLKVAGHLEHSWVRFAYYQGGVH